MEAVPASTVVAPGARMGAARRAPGEDPELTIVIPTLDAASERVRACVSAVQRCTDGPYEIVVVDNGAPPQGFTAPVNPGLRAARGRYAVVMNDDVEVLPGWWPPLREALDAGAAVTFPLTIDGAMRHDFAAWCFALSRATLEQVRDRARAVPRRALHRLVPGHRPEHAPAPGRPAAASSWRRRASATGSPRPSRPRIPS